MVSYITNRVYAWVCVTLENKVFVIVLYRFDEWNYLIETNARRHKNDN